MTTLSNVPPPLYVPKEIRAAFAEHEKLRVEESAARVAAHKLTDDQLDFRAKQADEVAMGDAIRAGLEPNPSAYRGKLAADRDAAELNAMHLRVALESVTREVNDWVANNTDALLAHETEIVTSAATDYAASVEVTIAARRAYYEARAAHDWAIILAEKRKSNLSWIGARHDTALDTELRKDARTHETRKTTTQTGLTF